MSAEWDPAVPDLSQSISRIEHQLDIFEFGMDEARASQEALISFQPLVELCEAIRGADSSAPASFLCDFQ